MHVLGAVQQTFSSPPPGFCSPAEASIPTGADVRPTMAASVQTASTSIMIKTKLKAAALKPGKAGMIGVLKEVLYMMYAAEDVIGTNVKQLVDKFANDVERKQFMVMISSIQELNGIVNKLLEKGRIC